MYYLNCKMVKNSKENWKSVTKRWNFSNF